MLGLGAVGGAVAVALATQGYSATGWSRSPHALPGVTCRAGPDALPYFLRTAEIVVNLLPLTAQTRNLFDRAFFGAMRPGAAFIHVGRGEQLVERLSPDVALLERSDVSLRDLAGD